MNEKELRVEKEYLIKQLIEKINVIKNEKDLNEIYTEVKRVNDLLDIHDSKFENLIDSIEGWFSARTRDKLKSKIRDIFDNYDKKNKDGSFKYSDDERQEIKKLFEIIDKICNRNFWERFKIVLGIGS